MKSGAAVLGIVVLVTTLPSCTNRWQERHLVGTYRLIHADGCRDDVRDSTLVIRGDGTFDQDVQLKSGRGEAIKTEHWIYDRKARRISFSKFLISPESSFSAEASHPAVIFVNPAGDCWYGHPK
jgi:hypothetical protein